MKTVSYVPSEKINYVIYVYAHLYALVKKKKEEKKKKKKNVKTKKKKKKNVICFVTLSCKDVS
jgi:hypothetical protein